MHGGIGRSIHSVEQIEKLERPITMDAGSIILMDLLWCVHVHIFFYMLLLAYAFFGLMTCTYTGLILQKTIALKV